MARVRTTVSLEPGLYAEARHHYQELGFTSLGHFISAAVRDYLQRRRVQDRLRVMAGAAHDTRYQKAVCDVTREFETVDTDEFGTGY